MKKIIISLFVLTLLSFSSCSLIKKPDIKQIKSICELSTVECFIHNVASVEKEAGTGILNWFEKDKKLWIEYTGIVKVGIDLDKVSMKIYGHTIEVKMPRVKALSYEIDEEQFINSVTYESKDGINKNLIEIEELQRLFVENANRDMRECVESNEWVMTNAQNRAKELIENYINQLGEISGKKYTVKWIEVEDDSASIAE